MALGKQILCYVVASAMDKGAWLKRIKCSFKGREGSVDKQHNCWYGSTQPIILIYSLWHQFPFLFDVDPSRVPSTLFGASIILVLRSTHSWVVWQGSCHDELCVLVNNVHVYSFLSRRLKLSDSTGLVYTV